MDFHKAIVVGASSGIGGRLARMLADRGCQVAAIARRQDALQQIASTSAGSIKPYAHDVTDFEATPAVFQKITSDLGGLDLVVYAAGVMPRIGLEEYDFEKDRQMIEVNVLGAIAWLNQAAIRFSHVGAGAILAIGSVAGDRGRIGQPVYNASKAALATYCEALRNRLTRQGVAVALVKPGPVETPMTEGLAMKNKMPVDKAASLILSKAGKTGEFYLSPVHALAFAAIRNIPSPIFRKMNV